MATKRFQGSFLLPEPWFPKYWTGSFVKTEYSISLFQVINDMDRRINLKKKLAALIFIVLVSFGIILGIYHERKQNSQISVLQKKLEILTGDATLSDADKFRLSVSDKGGITTWL